MKLCHIGLDREKAERLRSAFEPQSILFVEEDPTVSSRLSEFSAILFDIDEHDETVESLCERLRERSVLERPLLIGITRTTDADRWELIERFDVDDLISLAAGAVPLRLRAAFLVKRTHDVLERRRLMSEIVQRERTLETMMDTTPDALIRCEETGRVTLANRPARELFEYSADEFADLVVEDLVPHRLRERHAEHRERFFHAPFTRVLGSGAELYGVTKSGREFAADIAIAWHDENERRFATAAIRDVTRQRQLEAAFRRAKDELERAFDRVSRDVRAAGRVQQALLPDAASFDHPRVGFAWRYEPCETLAGDGLGFLKLDERRVGFYVFDVSGHGVQASLLAAMVANLFSTKTRSSTLVKLPLPGDMGYHLTSPEAVAKNLNDTFLEQPTRWQYFTMFYGVLDTESGVLDYTSAGHPGGVLQTADGMVESFCDPGFPIGLVKEAEYERRTRILAPGTRLILCSDGVLEAHDGDGREFGLEGVAEHVRTRASMSLDETAESLIRIASSRNPKHVEDDLSVLATEYRAPDEARA